MSDPTPPDLSQQNLGYQRAAEFLVHYIRKDTTAGNALLNEFGNSKDELERFIFALAEYAIAGAPAVATKRCAGHSSSWNARKPPGQRHLAGSRSADAVKAAVIALTIQATSQARRALRSWTVHPPPGVHSGNGPRSWPRQPG
jgi:hypothetical protein